jgi:TolB-like protein
VAKLLYLFDKFSLDTDRRELRHEGDLRSVEPQVFDLLEFLIRNRDRTVSRDDLLAGVWGGRIVSESTLSSRINAARAAIGDNGEEQRLIRTLLRKGIRFVGIVRERQELMERAGPYPPLPDKASIAVLPFKNMSGDPEQEYFVDGMVDEIITALSRMRWLFVIASNSSFTYKGRAVEIKQVSRELGVRYVLEGSLRKAGHRVRIIGQLIDATTGAHIWADRFDGAIEDIFDLQDQVAASVIGAIAPQLEQAEMERSRQKPTENLAAYDYFLRGMSKFYQWTTAANNEALELFYKAITGSRIRIGLRSGGRVLCLAQSDRLCRRSGARNRRNLEDGSTRDRIWQGRRFRYLLGRILARLHGRRIRRWGSLRGSGSSPKSELGESVAPERLGDNLAEQAGLGH